MTANRLEDAITSRSTAQPLPLASALVRWWWLALLSAVAAAAVGYALEVHKPREYAATAVILFQGSPDAVIVGGASSSSTPVTDQATDLALAALPVIAQRTQSALGGRYSLQEIEGELAVTTSGQAHVAIMTVTDRSPAAAAAIVNTAATELVVARRAASTAEISAAADRETQAISALPPADRSGPEAQALSAAVNSLRVLAAEQTGNAQVVQSATVPTSPVSQRASHGALIGGLSGCVIGLLLVALFNRLDRRVWSAEQAEALLSAPVVAGVPYREELRRGFGEIMTGPRARELLDLFHVLAANLFRSGSDDARPRVVAVVSPEIGDGKQTIGWHLAIATVLGGTRRVLLLEADTRWPHLAHDRGIPAASGLSALLAEDEVVADAFTVALVALVADGGSRLDVLVGGGAGANSVALASGRNMRALVSWARDHFDVVVMLVPPAGLAPEAADLMRLADGVLVVVRRRHTHLDRLGELRQQLDRLDVPVMGVAFNGAPRQKRGRASPHRRAGPARPARGAAAAPMRADSRQPRTNAEPPRRAG